jgi:hypothetical protein
MAALEAQAAGLPCILSDAVPREASQTADVTFLPAEDPDLWAERMLDILEEQEHRIRPDNVQLITDAGYGISTAADRLAARFEQLTKRSRAFRRRFLMTVPVSAKGVPAMNKARQDVQRFAAEAGYAQTKVTAADTAAEGWWPRLCLGVKVFCDWARLFFTLGWEDLLLVQYPVFPVKGVRLARFMLHMVQWKGARTVAIVHDLDSLRLLGGEAARWSDQVLLPAFVLGMVIKREHKSAKMDEGITTAISLLFMLLVGMSMPQISASAHVTYGSIMSSQPMPSWGMIALHVLAVSVLSNVGKLVPMLFYRNHSIRERLALSIGMFTRGEVGAGVIFIALGYSIGGAALLISVLTLVFNLVLTGGFVLIVKRLVAKDCSK